MADLHDSIRAVLRTWQPGTIYLTCPECSACRRKKRARCLSITVHDARAVFCCHHCGIRGVLFRDGEARLSRTERLERQRVAKAALQADLERRIRFARQVWSTTIPAAGTPVETYLRCRGL